LEKEIAPMETLKIGISTRTTKALRACLKILIKNKKDKL
jgi:hypothetical protein